MQFESTSIATIMSVVLEAMQKSYNFDARPVLEKLGIDLSRLGVPGARFPDERMDAVIEELQRRTGDDCIGLAIGRYVRPTTFNALGFAWLASSSLLGAFRRLARYVRIVGTADEIEVLSAADHYALVLSSSDPGKPPPDFSSDAFFAAILEMCRWISATDPTPLAVHLAHASHDRDGDYITAFGAPVTFNADDNRLLFDRALAEAEVPGGNEELARMSDRLSDNYLASFDTASVTREVRDLLLQLLPSGDASQDRIAAKLNRSCSSLQRDLRAEGTSFKAVRENTRKSLATDYVGRADVSLQEVAFLLGFSDQSNFSRAFRRWTGTSPKAWREANKI